MKNDVVLVDIFDNECGKSEKMAAHISGKLHRAYSIFLFNGKKILIQKRAKNKYHSGGLWSNSCCSHPAPKEDLFKSATRRLNDELGVTGVTLSEIFSFVYFYQFDDGIIEHELDHVLVGFYDGKIKLNKEEASACKWIDCLSLARRLEKEPERFTPWLHICAKPVIEHILSLYERQKILKKAK